MEKEEKLYITVFLSTECPLSQNYTRALNELYEKYNRNQLEIKAVFPIPYDNKTKIKAFIEKYQIKFGWKRDKNYKRCRLFDAQITPEVFSKNEEGKLLYTRKIDNWAVSLAQKRTVATKHYLQDAIEQYQKGQIIQIRRTEAVGCFIYPAQDDSK